MQKTKLFGDGTTGNVKGINALIAVSIGFLALIGDAVPLFFATIFPKFGVILSIFLVLLILVGFFYKPDAEGKMPNLAPIGWVLAILVIIWAVSEYGNGGFIFGGYNLQMFIQDYLWGLIILGGIGYLIYKMTK